MTRKHEPEWLTLPIIDMGTWEGHAELMRMLDVREERDDGA